MGAFSFGEFYARNVPLNSAAKWLDDADILAAAAIVAEGRLVWNKTRSADDCSTLRKLLRTENIRAVSANAVPPNLATEWVNVTDVIAALRIVTSRWRTIGIAGAEIDVAWVEA